MKLLAIFGGPTSPNCLGQPYLLLQSTAQLILGPPAAPPERIKATCSFNHGEHFIHTLWALAIRDCASRSQTTESEAEEGDDSMAESHKHQCTKPKRDEYARPLLLFTLYVGGFSTFIVSQQVCAFSDFWSTAIDRNG